MSETEALIHPVEEPVSHTQETPLANLGELPSTHQTESQQANTPNFSPLTSISDKSEAELKDFLRSMTGDSQSIVNEQSAPVVEHVGKEKLLPRTFHKVLKALKAMGQQFFQLMKLGKKS